MDICKIYQFPDILKYFGSTLMGEGFMGGCTPPFTIFFDFQLRSLRYEKDFLPVLSKLSQVFMVKIFHVSDEWKVVSVAPQNGGVHPYKSRGVFSDIFATASRLKHFVWT